MYVGIRDVCIFQAGYNNIAEAMDDLELDSVELAVERNMLIPAPDKPIGNWELSIANELAATEASEYYARLGIHISALLLANNFNAENRAAEIEWAVRALTAAELMGVEAVRLDAAMSGQRTLSVTQRVDIFGTAVEEILAQSDGGTVPLAVENHGHQGNDPNWLAALLARIDSPRLGITLDTANFYWAGHPLSRVYQTIEAVAARVCHVHCKNIEYPPKYRERRRRLGWRYGQYVVPIHQGDIDHEKIVAMLTEAGYQGGLHIEDESLARCNKGERKQLLREQADYLASLVEQVGGRRYWSG